MTLRLLCPDEGAFVDALCDRTNIARLRAHASGCPTCDARLRAWEDIEHQARASEAARRADDPRWDTMAEDILANLPPEPDTGRASAPWQGGGRTEREQVLSARSAPPRRRPWPLLVGSVAAALIVGLSLSAMDTTDPLEDEGRRLGAALLVDLDEDVAFGDSHWLDLPASTDGHPVATPLLALLPAPDVDDRIAGSTGDDPWLDPAVPGGWLAAIDDLDADTARTLLRSL